MKEKKHMIRGRYVEKRHKNKRRKFEYGRQRKPKEKDRIALFLALKSVRRSLQ